MWRIIATIILLAFLGALYFEINQAGFYFLNPLTYPISVALLGVVFGLAILKKIFG